MNEFDDSPVVSWDNIANWIFALLVALGLVFVALLVGLYQAGFFAWAANKFPGNAVLQFFFGTV